MFAEPGDTLRGVDAGFAWSGLSWPQEKRSANSRPSVSSLRQIGQPTLEPLPAYDQRLLDGHPNPAEAIAPCRPLIPGTVPYNVVRGTDASPPS